VEVPTVKSFKALGVEFKTAPTDLADLAKINGRGEWDPVSQKNMQLLLVPTKSLPVKKGHNLQ
jgi:hypothetical protein